MKIRATRIGMQARVASDILVPMKQHAAIIQHTAAIVQSWVVTFTYNIWFFLSLLRNINRSKTLIQPKTAKQMPAAMKRIANIILTTSSISSPKTISKPCFQAQPFHVSVSETACGRLAPYFSEYWPMLSAPTCSDSHSRWEK